MKISCVYAYPPNAGIQYPLYALRFVRSYFSFRPGIEHQTVIVLSGALVTPEHVSLFSELPDAEFICHNNSGWDIGAFQLAALPARPCDMMVFFGASTTFRREGWLKRMADAWEANGPALYGASGHHGNASWGIFPHIRTTAFWCSPDLMNEYPIRIVRPEQRYPFEHGQISFTLWANDHGAKPWVVGWNDARPLELHDVNSNHYRPDDPAELLAWDRWTEDFYANH